ncbi:acetaldehyde dehydrogenase (acetylating) [Streptomyces sp. V4I8]
MLVAEMVGRVQAYVPGYRLPAAGAWSAARRT